jgi:ATP-dependent RNA helicase DeaD
MNEFEKLGLSKSILRVIEEDKFEKPSEIQEKAIPLVLKGKDVIGGSATGSGKTLVFGSAIIQNSERGRGIQALVLTPTRELAEQVANALSHFSKYKPLNIVAIYGGMAIDPQMRALERADIVVGTPGRILDHMERRTINFENIKIVVLDEADRMLDMGFINDVLRIIRDCPKKRQTMLFSATIYDQAVSLARRHMNEPIEVSVESYVDPKKLTQVFYDIVDNSTKFSLLAHLLKKEKSELIMVFTNTRHTADFVSKNLIANDIKALAVHGGYTQSRRLNILKEFHAQNIRVLVCTDVAARGLDIEGISHVYNYDIPKDSKDYVHRIGRTARAGKEGKAINLLTDRDYENFSKIQQNESLNITKLEVPAIEKAFVQRFDGREGREGRSFGGRGFGARRFGGRGGDRGHSGSGGRFSRGGSPRGTFGRGREGGRERQGEGRGERGSSRGGMRGGFFMGKNAGKSREREGGERQEGYNRADREERGGERKYHRRSEGNERRYHSRNSGPSRTRNSRSRSR